MTGSYALFVERVFNKLQFSLAMEVNVKNTCYASTFPCKLNALHDQETWLKEWTKIIIIPLY